MIYRDYSLHHKDALKESSAITGLIFIILSLIFIKHSNAFLGWRVTLPVLGTLLIIGSGSDSWVSKQILSNRILIGIGLISYPLYLWHWSLLSFAHILEGEILGKPIILVILLISFILSWITYKFIEKPIRSTNYTKTEVVLKSWTGS